MLLQEMMKYNLWECTKQHVFQLNRLDGQLSELGAWLQSQTFAVQFSTVPPGRRTNQ